MYKYIRPAMCEQQAISHCCWIYQNVVTKQYIISSNGPSSKNDTTTKNYLLFEPKIVTHQPIYLSNIGESTIISMNDIINKKVKHGNFTYLLT